MNKWINISDIISRKGIRELKAGQVLGFDFEGSKNYYKIMRNYKGKLYVKPVTLHKLEDVRIVQK